MFIDSHAHLSMLINERNVSKTEIIQDLSANNVNAVVNISGEHAELKDAFEIQDDLLKEEIQIYHAAGIHPHEAEKASCDYSWIRENSEKLVAIGEVGLDFYYDFSPRKEQEIVFRNMIELSIELKKPLIIHGRSAEERALEIIKEYENDVGNVLFHCYTGNRKTALKIVEKGWFISFSGILTFKKSTEYHDILKEIGQDQIMFETDSPFLAPVPFRGKVNTPGKVFHVYKFASELLNVDLSEIERKIQGNFSGFFGIDL